MKQKRNNTGCGNRNKDPLECDENKMVNIIRETCESTDSDCSDSSGKSTHNVHIHCWDKDSCDLPNGFSRNCDNDSHAVWKVTYSCVPKDTTEPTGKTSTIWTTISTGTEVDGDSKTNSTLRKTSPSTKSAQVTGNYDTTEPTGKTSTIRTTISTGTEVDGASTFESTRTSTAASRMANERLASTLEPGVMVGIVACGLVAIILVVVIVMLYKRKSRRQRAIREDREFVLPEVDPTYAEVAEEGVTYREDLDGVIHQMNDKPQSHVPRTFAEQQEEGTAKGASMKENIIYGNH